MAPTSAPAPTGYDSPSSSYFILNNLPQGAEFGLDTQLWTVAKFSASLSPAGTLGSPTFPTPSPQRPPGVKFIPPGLHLFLFAASPRTNAARTEAVGAAGSLGVRHGLLRFFSPGETIVESYSELHEGLESDALRRRRRTVSATAAVETVTSVDYLKSLDSSLAAYPSDLLHSWPQLVNFITPTTLARVVGLDAQGSGRVDALMSSVADEREIDKGKDGEKRRQWGKEREQEPLEGVPKIIELEEGEDEVAGGEVGKDEDELLAFVAMDIKRSWPQGAQGQELSRWSQDKSWLLSKTVADLGGDPLQLLAELQLSFILFALLHNFSSLSTYKLLLTLFARSPALPLPTSLRPPNPPSPACPLLTTPSLPLFASLLSTLLAQFAFLAPDFFAVQMPGLEDFMLDEFGRMRQNLRDADEAWEREPAGNPGKGVWREVVGRWEELRLQTTEKWGWTVGEVRRPKRVLAEVDKAEEQAEEQAGRGSKWDDSSDEDDGGEGGAGGADEDVSGYIDIEDLEEGEDAPVIVEM